MLAETLRQEAPTSSRETEAKTNIDKLQA